MSSEFFAPKGIFFGFSILGPLLVISADFDLKRKNKLNLIKIFY